MSYTPQTEAQRLADELVHEATKRVCNVAMMPASLPIDAAKELRRLDAALDAELANRDVLDKMLTQCIAERDQLRAQLAKAVTSKCELLKALDLMEKAQAHIDGLPMFPTTHATEGARFKLFDARQAARAAITKATGEHHDN